MIVYSVPGGWLTCPPFSLEQNVLKQNTYHDVSFSQLHIDLAKIPIITNISPSTSDLLEARVSAYG